MGALGGLLGMGPAHQVQSQRGDPGFKDWGDDRMGGLMHNASGMSKPNEYTGGYPPGFGGGGQRGGQQGGFDPLSSIFGPQGIAGLMQSQQGQSAQMGGQMGGQMGQQAQNPYGIQPPRGLQGGGGPQQQAQQNNPLAGLFSMLGGL